MDRSLSVGDVIEATFSLLRGTFAKVASVAAILLVPGLVLLTVGLTQLGDFAAMFEMDPTTTAVDANLDAFSEPLFLVLVGLGSVLSFIGSAAAVPATMQVGVDHWNEVEPRVGRALSTGLKRMWGILTVWFALAAPLVVAVMVPGLLAIGADEPAWLALYFLVVPVVFAVGLVAIMYGYLVPAAVVAEDIGAWRALGRIRALLKGNFWPTFGRGLLIGFLLGLINSVLGFVSGFLGFFPPEVILVLAVLTNIISYLVITPLGNYAGLAIYGDLRIRAEGADVLAMAARLHG